MWLFSDYTSCHSTYCDPRSLFPPPGLNNSKRWFPTCSYLLWSAVVCVAMIHTAVWVSLVFTLPFALFIRITKQKWIKRSEFYVIWFYYANPLHFLSKMKPGSDHSRKPPSPAQTSILHRHLVYLWRTLPITRNTQFYNKHYSSSKKAPAVPCNVRNSS